MPVDEPLDADGNASGSEPQLQVQQVDEASLRALIKWTLGNRKTDDVDIESYGVTFEEFKEIYRDVVMSTYDFFYATPTCRTLYNSKTGQVLEFTPRYRSYDVANLDEEYTQLMANTAEVLSWVPRDASKLEQAKAVHDWLCWNVTYDYISRNTDNYQWYDHNVFGALNKLSGNPFWYRASAKDGTAGQHCWYRESA